MDSQEPEDWELPLTQVPVQFFQLSICKRHLRDEEQPFEYHIQPRLDPSLQQASLASLRSLHLSVRALVIILESEALLIDAHQVIFEGSFENNNEVQMVTRLSDDIGHRLYLQGLLNHLGSKRRASYIASLLHQILKFCMFKLLTYGFRMSAIVFSSYICGLSYYFGWLKSNI